MTFFLYVPVVFVYLLSYIKDKKVQRVIVVVVAVIAAGRKTRTKKISLK